MTPDGWRSVRFAEIADYSSGRTPARANSEYWQPEGKGVPWVTISDMADFGTVTSTKERISELAFQHVFGGTPARAGTLIMSFKLTIGRVATLGTDACHNEAIISIYPREGVDQRFLGYFLSQVDYAALQDRQVKGHTLNQDKIDRIEILLPPFAEQVQIADVLDLLRRAIDVQQNALQTTQALKRAAMHALFTRGLRAEARKDTDIGPVPASWDIQPLGDFFRIKHGFAFDGTRFRSAGEHVLMTPGHFLEQGGFRDLADKTKYYVGDFDRQFLLQTGDLLVAMTEQTHGLLGSAAKVPADHPYLHNQRLGLVVELDEGRLLKGFLYHLFNFQRVRDEISRTSTGSKVKHTSPDRIRVVVVPIPQIAEQQEIVDVLDTIDRKIDLHGRKRAVLEDLFKALLHELMTGEIRVSDLDLSSLASDVTAGAAA